jgi:hypothetical protein
MAVKGPVRRSHILEDDGTAQASAGDLVGIHSWRLLMDDERERIE